MTRTDDLDLLLARAIDRTADVDDWRGLESHAEREPQVWEELGRSLRDDGLLRGEIATRLSAASRVELPASPSGPLAAPAPITSLRRSSLRVWSGWAAALLLGLLWWAQVPGADSALAPNLGTDLGAGLGSGLVPDPGRAPVERLAGLFPPSAVVDAPAVPVAYPGAEPGSAGAFDLIAGGIDPVTGDTIVGELPSLLLDTVPTADGEGVDVVYVRRLVQRARVENVYAMGEDDLGRARPVAVEPAVFVVSESL